MIVKLSLTVFILFTTIQQCFSQGLFDRFQPQTTPAKISEEVKVINGKVKRFDRLTVPVLSYTLDRPLIYHVNQPMWQASANIVPDAPDSAITGKITFQQWPANNFIKLTVNVTGLPVGKHALHIHTFGDVSDGCKSTGGQFPNNFIGNVDTKEDGSISSAFLSSYLSLFGFHGIIGRSIVIHEKPIDINNSLNAEVFSAPLQAIPDTIAYQNEESLVGPAIACGIISITSTRSSNGGSMTMMPPPPAAL